MGSTSTIDWSKYSSPAASGNGQIDFSKYAGQAEPGAVDFPVIHTAAINSSPSVMSQDPRAAVASTLGREVKSFGQVFTGLPSAITSAVTTPITSEDKAKYGSTGNQTLDKLGIGLTRMIAQPIEHAAEWYGKVAKGQVPNAYEQALSVAPEAMGQGAGNVVLGKAMESGPSAVVNAPRDINAAIPSFDRSSQHFEAFENAYGSRPVDMTRLSAKAQKIADRMTENKAMSVPGPIQTILDKASGGEQPKIAGMDAAEFQRRAPEAYQKMVDAGAIQPSQPMNILQLRHLRTDLNNLIFDRNIADTFKGPMKDLAKSVQDEIVNSLPNQTAKNWYLATNKEANRAYAMQRKADAAGPYIGGGLGAGIGEKIGGLPGAAWGAGIGSAVGRVAGKPIVGGMVRSVLNRDIGPVTPPPGAIENIMQAAKDGTISPGEATRRIANMGGSTKVQPPKWAKYWTKDTYPDTGSQ